MKIKFSGFIKREKTEPGSDIRKRVGNLLCPQTIRIGFNRRPKFNLRPGNDQFRILTDARKTESKVKCRH